jgi:hypothetical protein
MFDIGTSTETTDTSTIVVELLPGERFDRVAVLGVYGCESVTCEVVSGVSGTLYDLTYSLRDIDRSSEPGTWYEYFFGTPYIFLDSVTFPVNTLETSVTVTVTLTKATGVTEVRCATVAVGRSSFLGETLDSVTISREDYSTIETNTFGDTSFVKRQSAKRVEAQLIMSSVVADATAKALADVGGEPAIFDLNNEDTIYDSLLVLGFHENFSINLKTDKSYCSLSVLELL